MTEEDLQNLLKKGLTIHAETKRTNTNAGTRRNNSKPKQGGRNALVKKKFTRPCMVNIDGKIFVRITRKVYRGRLDDDNVSGGAKQLRDAIATMLGRKGDSERDGLRFGYCEKPAKKGENKTIVELFKDEGVMPMD